MFFSLLNFQLFLTEYGGCVFPCRVEPGWEKTAGLRRLEPVLFEKSRMDALGH